ncbi:MAG TPA: nitrilase-related carbon-nitrogen hydrolase [Candidatus Binatia bacterium]|nr:nitrilase-related carbon-nitrogen hydrolase [Candidatus Binatia bacterium]
MTSEPTPASRQLRIAVAQYEPTVGALERNRARALTWVQAAAERGAQLVVLPELAASGYVFSGDEEAASLAEDPDTGATVTALTDACRRLGIHVVTGLAERVGDCRYNSAVVLGPEGRLATYRKLHLFYDEKSWFRPGSELVVVSLPQARVGVAICYDLWFPEVIRSLALQGADLIAVPTNWVGSFRSRLHDERGYCQGDFMAMAAAAANGTAVACADRIGVERDVTFLGASIIVGPDGWPLAGPASADREELLIVDLDLDAAERARRRTPRNHLLADRRPEIYGDLTAQPVTFA